LPCRTDANGNKVLPVPDVIAWLRGRNYGITEKLTYLERIAARMTPLTDLLPDSDPASG
jgi:hypothetical protein